MTDGVAQWQRLLLPAAVLAESDGRRTPRDWVVDALMYAFAVVFGIAILGATTSYRSDLTIGLDIALGVVSLVALWFRRTRPIEVAVVAIALSAFSALAAAAALAACFNASLRMSNGRRVAAVGLFGCVGAAVSAFSYGSAHGYDWSGLFVGLLLTTVAIGWGCSPARSASWWRRCTSARRGWRTSTACTPSRPATRSAAASRARCTTCWRTACRC